MLDPELGALLLWYTKEARSAHGLKAAKLIKWNTIVAEGTQPPLLESWTTDNEAGLERLKKKDIKMGDTAYGQLVALKKKELTAALGKSTKKERGECTCMYTHMHVYVHICHLVPFLNVTGLMCCKYWCCVQHCPWMHEF